MRTRIPNGHAALLCVAFLILAGIIAGCGGANSTYNPALIGGGGTPATSFSLSVMPASVTVTQGQAAVYTATLTTPDGFSGPVTLSVAGLPAGATAAFSSASVTPTSAGAVSTLTITTTGFNESRSLNGTIRSPNGTIHSRAATPPGTSPLTISASGAGITRTATVQLVVAPAGFPMFAIAVSPASRTIVQGQSTTYTVTVTPSNGFTGLVNLTATGLPASATAAFAPSAVTPTSAAVTSTLTIQTAAGTPAGTTTPTVIGTSGALTNQAAATLIVSAMPASGCTPEAVVGPGGIALSAWPKAGADVRNTGRGQGSGAVGVQKWAVSANSDSGGFQLTIGVDGTLYHTTYGTDTTPGKLYARNRSDGSVKWSFTASSGSITTVPTVGRNGLVYFADASRLFAVDAQTGIQRWATPATTTGNFLRKSPTLGPDGTVYVSSNGVLQAYDGNTGSILWTNIAFAADGATGNPWTSPALGSDGTLYVGSVVGGLYAIDGKHGCTRWRSDVGFVGGTAVGDDGTVYATVGAPRSAPTGVVAVEPTTGAVKWTTSGVPAESTPPALGRDGTVYVLGPQGQLTALSPANGSIKWTFKTPISGGNRAAPAIGADGTVYILNASILGNALYAVNPVDGTLKWQFAIDQFTLGDPRDATPTIDTDGTIYVCTFGFQLGHVIAVK